MKGLLKGVLASLVSFTRISVPWPLTQENFEDATWHIPLIGWLNVLLLAMLYTFLEVPADLKLFLILVIPVLLSGGMHEDGLADSADGLFGGLNKERRLAIMKDPRVGSFGVLSLVLYSLGYFLALKNLPAFAVISALAIALPLARLSGPLLAALLPYARAEVDANKAKHYLSGNRKKLVFSCFWCLPILLFMPTPTFGAVLILGFALTLFGCGWFFKKKLGGITGDCLGAAIKITELVLLWLIALHFQP